MTDTPIADAFAHALTHGLRETRRNPGGVVAGPGRPTDERHEQLVAEIRSVIDQAIEDAFRPWRRAVNWLAIGFAVFGVLNVVQVLLLR